MKRLENMAPFPPLVHQRSLHWLWYCCRISLALIKGTVLHLIRLQLESDQLRIVSMTKLWNRYLYLKSKTYIYSGGVCSLTNIVSRTSYCKIFITVAVLLERKLVTQWLMYGGGGGGQWRARSVGQTRGRRPLLHWRPNPYPATYPAKPSFLSRVHR